MWSGVISKVGQSEETLRLCYGCHLVVILRFTCWLLSCYLFFF